MKILQKAMASAVSLALLAGCAGDDVATGEAKIHSHRVSPVQPPLPELPPGSFDEAAAQRDLAVARTARAAGDLTAARAALDAALDHWPVSSAAWVELRAVCQAADDTPCLNYAGFFLTKVDFAATLPPRAASLGFETVAEKEPGSQSGPLVHDARSLAMARRLWIFYGRDDPLANGRAVPADQETFSERYPYATAVIAIGIGAAVITGLKSAAGAGATH